MNAPTAGAITSTELRELLELATPACIVDVRTPAEFETAHIAGSYNVPLDKHGAEVAEHLGQDHDVVLVCRSGQRSAQASQLLTKEGLTGGRILEKGIVDWEGQGVAVDRGTQRWDLERHRPAFGVGA
jgi:rhodanese-related sulfurtransferase